VQCADELFTELCGTPELVLMVGPPASGKSKLCSTRFSSTHVRVNQDTLKTKQKCFKYAEEMLKEGKSVVVDNTNAYVALRAEWRNLAQRLSVPVRYSVRTVG